MTIFNSYVKVPKGTVLSGARPQVAPQSLALLSWARDGLVRRRLERGSTQNAG